MAYTLGNKCAKMFVNGQFHIKLSSKMWSQVFLQHWSGKWLIRSEKACILHSAIIACLVYNWVHLYILCTKLTIACTAKNANIICLQVTTRTRTHFLYSATTSAHNTTDLPVHTASDLPLHESIRANHHHYISMGFTRQFAGKLLHQKALA